MSAISTRLDIPFQRDALGSLCPNVRIDRKRKEPGPGEMSVENAVLKRLALAAATSVVSSESESSLEGVDEFTDEEWTEEQVHEASLDSEGNCYPSEIERDDGTVFIFNGELGQGSVGRVVKTERLVKGEFQNICAMKLIYDDRDKGYAKNEMRVYSFLKSKNIPHTPRILSADKINYECAICDVKRTLFALQMPLYKGSLDDLYLDKGIQMPLEKAELMFRQLVEVMQHLEKHQFLHRDIKPGNIMEAEGPSYILADWDCGSKVGAKQTKLSGTTTYISPDALLIKKYGITADSWSAFTTFFHVLTQNYLFYVHGVGLDEEDDEHIVMRLIEEEIGSNPPESWFDPAVARRKTHEDEEPLYTEKAPRKLTRDASDEHLAWRNAYPLDKGFDWASRLKTALVKQQMPAGKIEQITDLGKHLMQYVRPKPSQYIYHPYFVEKV